MNEDLYGLQASGIAPEIAAKLIPLQRQQAVAEAMLKQSMNPIEVPRGTKFHPLQGLAQIVEAYMAQKSLSDADKQRQELTNQNAEMAKSAMGTYEKMRAGTPEIADIPLAGPGESDAGTATIPAKQGDPRAAVAMAVANPLLAKNPLIAADLGSLMSRKQAEPFTLKEGETRYGPDGKPIVSALPKTTNDSMIPEGWTPPAGTKAGPAPGTVWMSGADGKPELYGVKFQNGVPTGYQKLDTATRVTVPVSLSTEKKYGEQFAGKIAGQDTELLDAARKAPELATRSNNILSILANEKPYTGSMAEWKLGFDKVLSSSGITDSSGRAVSTETLAADLASGTLDAIKSSGLGSGNGFSNADRDFLEKAKGGKITLEQGTIKRLAELSHRAATLSANQWNSRVKDIPEDALKGTGIKRDPISVPSIFGKQIGKTVVERRTTPSGKKLVKYSDGTIGEE